MTRNLSKRGIPSASFLVKLAATEILGKIPQRGREAITFWVTTLTRRATSHSSHGELSFRHKRFCTSESALRGGLVRNFFCDFCFTHVKCVFL